MGRDLPDHPIILKMYHCLIILLMQQQLVQVLSQSETSTTTTAVTPSATHPDIVVLKWPPAPTYDPPYRTSPSIFDEDDEDNSVTNSPSTDQLEDRNDYNPGSELNAINIVVPQSPDPSSPNEVPLPPHPYYRDMPSVYDQKDNDDDEDEKSPESEWQKVREKIRLKPVNHDMFKTNGKPVATLPYAPTKPFYDLQHGIDQIRRAVHKMHPMAGMANDVFKKFNSAVRTRIMNMRGPYGYSYPPGYYDNIYEPDDNPNYSEPRPVFVEPPTTTLLSASNETSTSATEEIKNSTTSITTTTPGPPMERRSDRDQYYDPPVSAPPPDPDQDDDLEQRSFGFKVTVYKTPQGKGEWNKREK